MRSILHKILNSGRAAPADQRGRPRLSSATWPAAVYAVGDVHGCLGLLRRMEQAIAADAERIVGEIWIVCLGDYVDRGPNSAGVLDYLLAPQPHGMKRICLAGNHEALMLEHIEEPSDASGWLDLGAHQTLQSYGISADAYSSMNRADRRKMLSSYIPSEHREWLSNLPVLLSLPGAVFVHAGLRPGVPLTKQSEHDMMWIRGGFLDTGRVDGPWVVHGHTPVERPIIDGRRIGVDTAAFATGRLSAVRLLEHGAPIVLHVS